MASATWNGVDIPLIFSYDLTREIGGDMARTAGGKMQMVYLYYKREWLLETRPMTVVQRDALVTALTTASWGVGDFWLDEFGSTSNTIPAFLRIEGETRDVDNLPTRRALSIWVIEQ